MKRSIFYLICAVAVGGAACQKLPEASTPSSNEPKTSPTPAATATPPPVGEQLEPRHVPAHPGQQSAPGGQPNAPAKPEIPVYPGSGQNPGPSSNQLPPHRKPPVSAKMEV